MFLKKTICDKLVAKTNFIDTSGFDKDKSKIENKVPDTSKQLVKKIDPEFNTLVAGVHNAILAQANLITKTDFDAKLLSLYIKITTNKAKHLLIENEFKKLKTFDSIDFTGKSHFEEDGMQKLFSISTKKKIF